MSEEKAELTEEEAKAIEEERAEKVMKIATEVLKKYEVAFRELAK